MAPELTFAVTCLLAGAGMCVQQLPPLRRALATRRWVPTRGRVLSSRVTGIEEGLAHVHSAAPVVRYEYEAGGRRHRGDVVSWNGFTGRGAVETHLRYEPGDVVTVWYDPDQPQQAVLEPGASALAWLRAALAVTVLAVGVVWTAGILSSTA